MTISSHEHETGPVAEPADELRPIAEPYLLVIGIPIFVDADGKRWVDDLWHKDLVEHLTYLKNLTLAAPLRQHAQPAGAQCISDDVRFADLKYVDLPASDSLIAGVFDWPRIFSRLWHAVGRARIVHAGVAEWPIPLGWAATIAAKLRRRPLLINIESAFWRVPPNAPLPKRARAWLWERINGWCVRQAALPLFTQREYARQMLGRADRAHIFQASWIDGADLIDERAADASWDAKDQDPQLRLLFAGRLVPEKGISDLLAAVGGLQFPLRLDVIGSGELASEVLDAARRDPRIRLLPPVPYDSSFFELVREYHALMLPGRTDEQPRIAYDAYSQAVPVLATATAGNAECVIDGQAGYLCPTQDIPALAGMIQKANVDRASLRKMGMRALSVARGYTHQEMHRRRWKLLATFLRLSETVSSRHGGNASL
ncbi:glycosyltransferase [Sphingomonas sp.]|uniref:glycosyltransferase n=1 Tax=Sphingomonas sp. TaxID=28214 RepID=UPI0038A9725A